MPTSPVRTMNPLCAEMPYSSVARASRVCGIMYRNRGSGLPANGIDLEMEEALIHGYPGASAASSLGGLRRKSRFSQANLPGFSSIPADQAITASVGS